MVDELQRSNFFRGLLDGFSYLRIFQNLSLCLFKFDCDRFTKSKRHIYSCRCSFQYTKCSDDRRWHSILRLIDLEVLQRPKCRCQSQFILSLIPLLLSKTWAHKGTRLKLLRSGKLHTVQSGLPNICPREPIQYLNLLPCCIT